MAAESSTPLATEWENGKLIEGAIEGGFEDEIGAIDSGEI